MRDCGLKGVQRSEDVDLRPPDRILAAAGDENARKVHDRVAARNRRVDVRWGGDVAQDELDVGRVLARHDLVEQRALGMKVEDADCVSRFEKRARRPRADEAETAGDENSHSVLAFREVADVAFGVREVPEHRPARGFGIAPLDGAVDRLVLGQRAREQLRKRIGHLHAEVDELLDRLEHSLEDGVLGSFDQNPVKSRVAGHELGGVSLGALHAGDGSLERGEVFGTATPRRERGDLALEDAARLDQVAEDGRHRASLATRC